ncbi:MAG TPA: hypothetical protein VGG34_13255 [Opitutaceae bacterium]|jgi:hypothetical protein
MNTNSPVAKTLLGALAAAALLPVSPAAAIVAVTIAGMACLLLSDYGPSAAPAAAAAAVVPFALHAERQVALDRAA